MAGLVRHKSREYGKPFFQVPAKVGGRKVGQSDMKRETEARGLSERVWGPESTGVGVSAVSLFLFLCEPIHPPFPAGV